MIVESEYYLNRPTSISRARGLKKISTSLVFKLVEARKPGVLMHEKKEIRNKVFERVSREVDDFNEVPENLMRKYPTTREWLMFCTRCLELIKASTFDEFKN